MSSYVCARLRSTGGAHQRISAHNVRTKAPDYLRGDPETETHHVTARGERNVFHAADQDAARILSEDLSAREEAIRADYKRRHKRSMPRNAVPFVELFLTFSPGPFEEGRVNLQEWKTACARMAALLKRKTGGKVVYLAFHFDEKTPHCHVLLENYSREKGRSWLRTFSKSDCRQLQDEAGRVFAPLGFQRGEEKSITGARHLSLVESHHAERKRLEDQVQALRAELEGRKEERRKLIEETRELEEDAAIRKSIYQRFDAATRAKKEELRVLNAALLSELERSGVLR